MNKLIIILALLISNFLAAQNNKQGYIFSITVDVDERLRAMEPEKNFNGFTFAKTSKGNPILKKGVFDGNEVTRILKGIASEIQANSKMDTVSYVSAQKSPSFKKGLYSIGKNVLNEAALEQKATYYTMEFFPSIRIKKAFKSKSNEYYDIKIKVKSGGNASDMVVMNKVKKKAFVKYAIDVTITAKGPDKKEIWKKKGSFNDFTKNVTGSVDKKFYKIEGTQKLTISTIEDSMLIALNLLFEQ